MAICAETPVLPAVDELHSSIADNFSLTRGGPLYRLQCRLGATDEARKVAMRAVTVVLVTWFPLLLLSAMQELALGKHIPIPFLQDFAVNVRFFIALPLLIIPEVAIDQKLRITVRHFLKSGLVKKADLLSFEAAIGKITRLRDRVLPELLLLAVAYLPSLSLHSAGILGNAGIPSWHLAHTPSGETLSYAGWWFGLVSVPIYRFLLLRWVWRIFLWAFFMRLVSKIDLILIPTHPDTAAGIGFLSGAQVKFGLIAFACGAVAAGRMGNSIAYEGATVGGMKYTMIGYCLIATLALASPLLLFVPKLLAVKKRGLLEYGALATGYTQRFDAKWVHGRPPEGETLLGSADIQSLADLGNSFDVVQRMRTAPIDKRTLIGFAVAAGIPMLPVLLLGTSVDKVIETVWKLLA